ncbi:MAG: hypothetical protein WC548_01855 [Candidatus Pacearchaeota archaeon]
MKIKEISSGKKKVKEIKKEEKTELEQEVQKEEVPKNFADSENENPENDEQLNGKEIDEEKEFALRDFILKPEDPPITNLEETLSEMPIENKEESRGNLSSSGNFYSTNKDFYSSLNGSNLYGGASSNNLYETGNEQDENESFYNMLKSEEKVGEIRGERRSQLEIEGIKGKLENNDNRRKGEEKYKTKTY